jgi:hypothetical protein
MINNGSGRGFEVALLCAIVLSSSLGLLPGYCAPDKGKTAADKKADKKTDAKTEKKAEAKTPEPVIENVQNVTTDQLVDKPHEWMNKNVKFDAPFHAFSSIALDYKPAMRASKDHLSFLVLRPNGSHIPYSELKLAMTIPKEKDPENTLLAGLKEGDTLEITGHVFATALDEPWVDVLKLKKIASAPEKKETAEEKKTGDTEPETKGKDVKPEHK